MTIRSYQYTVQVLITASKLSFDVQQALGLVDEATDGIRRVVSDEIEWVQNASGIPQPSGTIPLTQELGLVETVKVFGYEQVTHELGLTEDVEAIFPIAKNFTHNFVVKDTVSYGFLIQNKTVEDVLNLQDSAGVARTFFVTDNLSLSSIAFRSYTPSSELNLVETVEWGYGFDAEDNLNLTQLADNDLVLFQTVNQDNIILQSLTWFVESPCARFEFNTFHGLGGVEPLPQKLNYKSQFTLYSIDDGTTINMRNPETDDRRRYKFNRVNRNYLDGSPDIYSDPNWVTDQDQIYTVVANKREVLDSVQDFLVDNLGREVVVKDWRGVSWIVIITNPGEVYTEDAEGFWTLVFECSGLAVDGELVYDRLGLMEDLSRAGSIWTRLTAHDTALVDRANRHYEEEVSNVSIVTDEVTETVETP